MSEKRGTIYMITAPSGKSYIGKTLHFERRMVEHQKTQSCPALAEAIARHGWDAMEVRKLHENVPEDKLRKLEKQAIMRQNTRTPYGYNIKLGGGGGTPKKRPPIPKRTPVKTEKDELADKKFQSKRREIKRRRAGQQFFWEN